MINILYVCVRSEREKEFTFTFTENNVFIRYVKHNKLILVKQNQLVN